MERRGYFLAILVDRLNREDCMPSGDWGCWLVAALLETIILNSNLNPFDNFFNF